MNQIATTTEVTEIKQVTSVKTTASSLLNEDSTTAHNKMPGSLKESDISVDTTTEFMKKLKEANSKKIKLTVVETTASNITVRWSHVKKAGLIGFLLRYYKLNDNEQKVNYISLALL